MVRLAIAHLSWPFRRTLPLTNLRSEDPFDGESRRGRTGKRTRGIEMIRASVQVKDESNAFSVTVCAENLRRAVELAANWYPGYAVSLRFPLDPESFLVEGPLPRTEAPGTRSGAL